MPTNAACYTMRAVTSVPHKGRLLVVDDDPMNQAVLRDLLSKEGLDVATANHGYDALDQLASGRFDLVLLDLDMPEMDGYELLRQMKSDAALRNVPVIIISGMNDLEAVLRGIQMGAVDHLPKPFNALLLRTRIDACLEKKRWRDQEQEYLRQIRVEREKSEQLLLNILPGSVATRLKGGETVIADQFEQVSILFADLVGFTNLSTMVSPTAVVLMLNEIFSAFDQLAARHGLEKIKTIGDCYMVVGGLPSPNPNHASAVAEMALDMMQEIRRLNEGFHSSLRMRIGINTGTAVAGIIGKQKFIYDLWGDAVNTASRMESHSLPDRIQVSESTFEALKDTYEFESRGVIDVKGKGPMPTYWLMGRKG
ncbi:MAG: adenylate/guanylate cyclase domain-containing protein [Verrucomicrobiota bacterium]